MTEDFNDTPGMPVDHYVLGLGLQLRVANGVVEGTATVLDKFFAPGTRRIRTGLLVTMLDLAAGHVPVEAINPTVDIRLALFGTVPDEGQIQLRASALRVGRRLVVSETTMCDAAGVEFARGVATFINQPVGSDVLLIARPPAPIPEASYDDVLGARPRGEMSMELEPHLRVSNGRSGTVQGGAQALLAELAMERAIGLGPVAVTNIDIRYLAGLRVGPLVATVTPLGNWDLPMRQRQACVSMVDEGDSNRLVSYATLTATPINVDSLSAHARS